jgi:gamma-glutamyltranspeptidase / glutathione hydrolase
MSELQPTATVRAGRGMVCSVDHLASRAGVAMLRAGGTAVDAAVATSAVLAVTSQHLCGMGGDLMAVVVVPGSAPVALNASGRAGSGADAARLRDEGHSVMPLRGDIRSVTVPGCVDGWLALHERFGKLPLAQVLAPAQGYARDGFPASPTLASSVARLAGLPDADDFTGVGPVAEGTVLRRPGVARALGAISASGRGGFYEGEFGEGLVALGGGEFSEDDLSTPLAQWTDALGIDAWGHRLWTVPPNSQGYLTLASAWIASGLDLPEDASDPQWPHLLIEASRQAGHDRLAVLYEGANGETLLDRAALSARRARIDPSRAVDLGDAYRAGDTVALCAVDDDRMGVSLLQSNASGYGAHIVVPQVRIFLHNRGVGFSLVPGHPGELGPRRRPPHTLSPLAVTNVDGGLRAVAGTMGGDGQPQILLQLLARALVNGEAPGSAVAAGRWLLTGGPTGFDTWHEGGNALTVEIEGQAPSSWANGLARRGHRVEVTGEFSHAFGHAHLIVANADHLAAGTDPRPRFGAAAGY